MMPDEDDTSATTTTATPTEGGGIKTAAEVIEKVLAAPDKPEPKGSEPPTRPDPAPKPVARRIEKLEAKAAEKTAAAAETPEPEADASAVERARFHLKHGDVAKALDVFGDLKALGEGMPDAVREALGRKLGVNSAQWEKLRKFEAGAKRAIATREQELSGLVQQLRAEYAPLHEARAAYKAGDYDAAFKAAFGEDAADYQRKIITQRVGKNPEVEKLRAELEAERTERRKLAERDQAAQVEAAERQQIAEYVSTLGAQLAASEDPAVRKYSSRPAFVQRVYDIQRESYDHDSRTFLPAHIAAETARDEILNSLKEWSVDDATGAAPANAARASALPAKPPVAKAPARALKQSQAAEASGQPHTLSPKQVMEKHMRLMEQATD